MVENLCMTLNERTVLRTHLRIPSHPVFVLVLNLKGFLGSIDALYQHIYVEHPCSLASVLSQPKSNDNFLRFILHGLELVCIYLDLADQVFVEFDSIRVVVFILHFLKVVHSLLFFCCDLGNCVVVVVYFSLRSKDVSLKQGIFVVVVLLLHLHQFFLFRLVNYKIFLPLSLSINLILSI